MLKRIMMLFSIIPCLLLAQAKDSTVSLSFGETVMVSRFFANARVATINASKAQFDTVAAVAAFGERLTNVLSDTTRKAVLLVNSFDRYFISRMLDQKGLEIPAPWASTLIQIRKKLGRFPIPPITDKGKK